VLNSAIHLQPSFKRDLKCKSRGAGAVAFEPLPRHISDSFRSSAFDRKEFRRQVRGIFGVQPLLKHFLSIREEIPILGVFTSGAISKASEEIRKWKESLVL
jgi:hypothetical protein